MSFSCWVIPDEAVIFMSAPSESLRSGESDDESLPASRPRDIRQLADVVHAEICGAWSMTITQAFTARRWEGPPWQAFFYDR